MKNELPELEEQAKAGSTPAMISMARIYYYGIGVDPDSDKALELLRQAVAAGRTDANLPIGLIYYEQEGGRETDQKAWDAFYTAYEDNDIFGYYLGKMLYENRGDRYEADTDRLRDAADFFKESLESDFRAIESGLYLWAIYLELGARFEADCYYYDAEQNLMEPTDYNTWAYGLWEMGKYEQALPYIEKCMQMDGAQDDPNYLDTYAKILYSLDRKLEARELFDKCVALYRQRDIRRMLREEEEVITKRFV